jgi:hypothetical protein
MHAQYLSRNPEGETEKTAYITRRSVGTDLKVSLIGDR